MIKLKALLAEDNYYGSYNKKRNAAADEYRPAGLAVEPTPTEWNDLIDQLNDDPRFTTHSSGQKQYVKNNETGKSFAIQWDTMDGYWRAPGADTKAEDVVAMARKEYGIDESGLTEQIVREADPAKILVKNFLKFKFPTKTAEIENKWMASYTNVDNMFESLGLNLDATKTEYMAWLQKNGFKRSDIYVDDTNLVRVQQQLLAKRFK